MLIAGIGCRRDVPADDILAALDATLAACSLDRHALAALATGFTKADEPGLKQAATRLGLPLSVFGAEELTAMESRLLTHSEQSFTATGSSSLSEAAALAAAGPGAHLLGPRFIHGGVTIALAICGDNP